MPIFRATAVSWAVANYSTLESSLGLYAERAQFAEISATGATAVGDAVEAVQAAAEAAHEFAYAAIPTIDAVTYAADAIGGTSIWSNVSIDVTRVEGGATASVIARSPLWPNDLPDQLRSLWQELKTALLAADEVWDVWTDWYEDRLDGRVREEERELAYVRIDEALWKQGPAIVNAEIKRRIEELPAIKSVPADNPPFGELQSSSAANAILAAWQPDEHGVVQLEALGQSGLQGRAGPLNTAALNTLALNQANTAIGSAPSVAELVPPIEAIPEQEPIATRFGVNSEGLIDVLPDPPAPETAADHLQRDLYAETRFKTQALIELGPNQLGDLSGSVERFREGLKERIDDISITSLWSRGNTLRSRLKAHDLSPSNGEPDPARLHFLVAETRVIWCIHGMSLLSATRKGANLMKFALDLRKCRRRGRLSPLLRRLLRLFNTRKMSRRQRR